MRTEPPRAQHPLSTGWDVIVTWWKRISPYLQSKRAELPAELQSESWGGIWPHDPCPPIRASTNHSVIPCTRQTQQICEVRMSLPSSPAPFHCIQVQQVTQSQGTDPASLDPHFWVDTWQIWKQKPSWTGTHLNTDRLQLSYRCSRISPHPRWSGWNSNYLGDSSCSRAEHNLAEKKAGASEELTLHIQVPPAVDPGSEHRERRGPSLGPAVVHHRETACPHAHSSLHHKRCRSRWSGPAWAGSLDSRCFLASLCRHTVIYQVSTGEVGQQHDKLEPSCQVACVKWK